MWGDERKSVHTFFMITGALLFVALCAVVVAFFLVQNTFFNNGTTIDNVHKIAQNE